MTNTGTRSPRCRILLLLPILLMGCGGTVEVQEPSKPTSSGDSARPPHPGPPKPSDGPGTTLAIRHLFLGDSRRDGTLVAEAWKDFGFDLDGSALPQGAASECTPTGVGISAKATEDGNGGRDNAFGSALLPLLFGGFEGSPSEVVSDAIGDGAGTIQVHLEGVGAGPQYNPIHAMVYLGARLAGETGDDDVPKWDGTDEWLVTADSVMDGSLDEPVLAFPDSYVVSDPVTGRRTWVSGPMDPSRTLRLPLSGLGVPFILRIHAPILTMDLSEDNALGDGGTIAGVLDPEEVICELEYLVGSFDQSLTCWESPPDGVPTDSPMLEVLEATDVMLAPGSDSDGTDPPSKCDGISFGIGFFAQAATVNGVADEVEPDDDDCQCQ